MWGSGVVRCRGGGAPAPVAAAMASADTEALAAKLSASAAKSSPRDLMYAAMAAFLHVFGRAARATAGIGVRSFPSPVRRGRRSGSHSSPRCRSVSAMVTGVGGFRRCILAHEGEWPEGPRVCPADGQALREGLGEFACRIQQHQYSGHGTERSRARGAGREGRSLGEQTRWGVGVAWSWYAGR